MKPGIIFFSLSFIKKTCIKYQLCTRHWLHSVPALKGHQANGGDGHKHTDTRIEVLNSNVSSEVWKYKEGVPGFASAAAKAWGGQNGFTGKVDAVSSKYENPDVEIQPKARAQLCHSLAM